MAYAKIRPKRGTAAQWTAANTILAEGEIGIEVPDEGVGSGHIRIKQGNGSTPWNELPYASGLALEDVLEQLNATNVNYQAVNVSEFVDKDVTVRELYNALPLPCNVTIPVIAPNSKGKFGVSGLPSSSTGTLTIVKYLVPSVAINGTTDLKECHQLIFWGATNPAGFNFSVGTGKPLAAPNWKLTASMEDIQRQGAITGEYVGVEGQQVITYTDEGNYRASMAVVTWNASTDSLVAFIFPDISVIFRTTQNNSAGPWTYIYPNKPMSQTTGALLTDAALTNTALRFNYSASGELLNDDACISRLLNFKNRLYKYTIFSSKEV